MNQTRQAFIEAVKADLVGPVGGERERLVRERPSDRYLTGILYPDQAELFQAEVNAEEDDDRGEASDDDGGPDVPIPMSAMRRPSSMGVSFSLRGSSMRLEGTAGRYARRWLEGDDVTENEGHRSKECWVREPVELTIDIELGDGRLMPHAAVDGLRWWTRTLPSGDGLQVTVVLENVRPAVKGRIELEESSYFQVSFRVRAGEGAELVPRRPARTRTSSADEDLASSNLIYRGMEEWAVGHTCSATWGSDERGRFVEATWVPEQHVPAMNPDGHEVFAAGSSAVTGSRTGAFLASGLASASREQLLAMLEVIPRAYTSWIDARQHDASALPPGHAQQARQHLARAGHIAARMRGCIELLANDEPALRAFKLAQDAMLLQRRWTTGNDEEELRWRPFQLAFQLLGIPGLVTAERDGRPTDERCTMDLLWFPTGGGKTEAYLGLVAFLLFHRRLRHEPRPDDGAGVAAIMRYTLRLLTVQQFERASRMVLACELLRREAAQQEDLSLGTEPFSIGLWVGAEATPNTLADARSSADEMRKARQLTRCPACRSPGLVWDRAGTGPDYTVECDLSSCPLHGAPLPVFTIDEVVYQRRPSLLIGTVDKFAQIVRKAATGRLLGRNGLPPDLILQDELHLISGPLGTVVGLYEAAIDRICARDGIPPKVIGSTATIRRAREQVRGLFDRDVSQFPPPAIDWEDSCFAVKDDSVPGRVYVGVTTVGRSPKFTLQATCAAAMQRAAPTEGLFACDEQRDPYWTLLAYFNSMRELGGALVMMLDDVNDSMAVYARSHGRNARDRIEEPLELTSRVPSAEIPDILVRLERSLPDQDVSVVLATNMISVGVDIPRLGLMVINGQPKSMAEYIQASSRVGRNQVPGLIFTVYNAGRARDRAHYESFRTWHQALYREVEATSVTPFAPRARDKALHAALVALARHLVPGMQEDAELTDERREMLDRYAHALYDRASHCDRGEADETRTQISALLEMWAARGPLANFWDDYRPASSLLVSAERVAEAKATSRGWRHAALSTPNSMREVEPSVRFRMVHALRTAAPTSTTGDVSGSKQDQEG
ncbi:helicase-related protein [Sorangium sp. So ce362]|uniref:helicase-related protein n=1 Tax=Sorangium sp. So ce362 TaxID=3133303 RepID=UPI003F63231D